MPDKKQKVIVVMAQKGGVGKTTVASEIAYGFARRGHRVAYLDYDGQGGLIHKAATPDEAAAADIIVVDTPGHLTVDSGRYAAMADAVVIPTLAGALELPPLRTVRDIVERSGTPYMYVLNRNDNFNYCKQFREFLEENRGEVQLAYLPQAQDFLWAADAGKSVVDVNPKGKAATYADLMCDLLSHMMRTSMKGQNNG